MKYGEVDAQRAEAAFYEFRQQSFDSQTSRQVPRMVSTLDKPSGHTDGERKYLKMHSDATVGLLQQKDLFEPVSRQTSERLIV